MPRTPILVLVLALTAGAAGEYEAVLLEAQRLEREHRPGEGADLPYDRAYVHLEQAAKIAPHRWEAFMWRGLNRCAKANIVRDMAARNLQAMRAKGTDERTLQYMEMKSREFLDVCMADAHQNFVAMEQRMRKLKEEDPNRILFSNACMKYAGAEYQQAKRGERGAIEDFKVLVGRGFMRELCRNLIAKCYNTLGATAFGDEDYDEAHKHWDEALKWVADPHLRRVIFTNKAGAFEMDNEFGLAEDVLRKQIEKDPRRPGHWKNLGLLLGFQGRNREALHAYGKAREICKTTRASVFLGIFHGNAWLRAAMIHGKLLETDGDLKLAWRLFLEYRKLFGDDYNFCLAFGDFLVHMGQYDLAWTFLTRARDLQPHCPTPYKLLLQAAPRTDGTADEVRARVEKAKEDARTARERFLPREESAQLKRICGGLRDVGDGGGVTAKPEWIRPDPLPGLDIDEPPAWIEDAAADREPFKPYVPGSGPATDVELPAPEHDAEAPPKVPVLPIAIGGAALLALLAFVWIRK